MKKNVAVYLKIILGSLFIALGIYYFWAPSELAAGGISGLAIVVQYFLKNIPISLIILGLDMMMFVLGFLILGANFGLKSIVSSLSIAGCMRVFEVITPQMQAFSNDTLIILIFGGLFIAIGQAIVFRQGASSGGTDIIAKIITKFMRLPIAASLLIADMVVVVLAIGTFGIEKGLYAALGVILVTLMIDYFISGLTVEKYVMIIPSDEIYIKPINDYILYELERGATMYKAEGAYSNHPKEVITTVINSREFVLMKQKVQEVDPLAFVTVQNLHEVMGEGFKRKQV